jgi:hypothetical protein
LGSTKAKQALAKRLLAAWQPWVELEPRLLAQVLKIIFNDEGLILVKLLQKNWSQKVGF